MEISNKVIVIAEVGVNNNGNIEISYFFSESELFEEN